MRLPWVLLCVCAVALGLLAPAADAAMVDFEPGTYTAGSGFAGVDGWVALGTPTTVVTDSIVLAGSQSGQISGSSIVLRRFDAASALLGDGTVVSGHMLVNSASGSGQFYFSHNVAGWGTPAGIVGNAGGSFGLFGSAAQGGAAGDIATGVPFATGKDYLLEFELDLTDQLFNAYATNVTDSGVRTSLGSAYFAGAVNPSSYATGGFGVINGGGAVVVYDDFDIALPPPVPLLPGKVDFEAPVYVPGQSVIGVDGWGHFLGATAVVTTAALEGDKSVKLSGSRSIAYRHFGPGTTYDDGTIVSAKMLADGSSPAGTTSEFFFSHNPENASTPAGIIGVVGGNFWVWGIQDGAIVTNGGIETDVPFLTDTDYLLELELDMTGQTFTPYVTNLTAGEDRVSLGTAELWSLSGLGEPVVIPPGDDTTGGWILVTRGGAVATYDALNCEVPEPSTLVSLIGLLVGGLVFARSHAGGRNGFLLRSVGESWCGPSEASPTNKVIGQVPVGLAPLGPP